MYEEGFQFGKLLVKLLTGHKEKVFILANEI